MGLFARLFSALGLRKRDPDLDLDADDDLEGDLDRQPSADESDDAASSSRPADSAGDDVERDLELEAQDDCASFEFERDIARFFTAEFRIEQGWNNPKRRQQLFGEYAIRDGVHWYQVKATFKRWLESPVGKAKYPSDSALMQARMTTTQTVTADELEQMIEDAQRAKG